MRLLLTAFEPYDEWEENSSWETLVEFLRERGGNPSIVTRRYPVDLQRMNTCLERDLSQGFDAVLHLGQRPGAAAIHIETISLNVAGVMQRNQDVHGPLLPSAPLAYRSRFPVGRWLNELHDHHIPAEISYHAGTYLCNGLMFLTQHWFESREESVPVGFLHLPLTPKQVFKSGRSLPSMSTSQLSRALGLIVDQILIANESSVA